TLTAQPAASAEYSQFLTDVMTAAGLVSHGKQCKALGERLGARAMKYRFQADPAVPTDEQCMESESVAQGMSLRDYFAAKALANAYTQCEGDPDKAAEWAYQLADAMLRVRQEASHDS